MIREVAERCGYLPVGVPALLDLSDRAFNGILYSDENQDYQAWLGPPVSEDGFVRGTREDAPEQCPRSKYEALFDNRPIFDAIPQDFLKRADPKSKLKRVRLILEDLLQTDHVPHHSRALVDAFVNDLKTTDSDCITSPPGFAADAWSCYVQAISSSSCYVSMDELLLVCQCAKQNVIVYIQEGSGLRYAGSWLREHGNTVSVKLAFDPLSRRGHFERVLPASALVNQPNDDDSQTSSKPLPGNDDA